MIWNAPFRLKKRLRVWTSGPQGLARGYMHSWKEIATSGSGVQKAKPSIRKCAFANLRTVEIPASEGTTAASGLQFDSDGKQGTTSREQAILSDGTIRKKKGLLDLLGRACRGDSEPASAWCPDPKFQSIAFRKLRLADRTVSRASQFLQPVLSAIQRFPQGGGARRRSTPSRRCCRLYCLRMVVGKDSVSDQSTERRFNLRNVSPVHGRPIQADQPILNSIVGAAPDLELPMGQRGATKLPC